MKNAYSDFEYTYDLMGNLLEQYDCITDYTVSFQYDNYGRCINKKGNNFSIKYDYDNNGRLQRILDIRTGLWILFEYDKCSRIVKEVCSNGITTSIVGEPNVGKSSLLNALLDEVAKSGIEEVWNEEIRAYEEAHSHDNRHTSESPKQKSCINVILDELLLFAIKTGIGLIIIMIMMLVLFRFLLHFQSHGMIFIKEKLRIVAFISKKMIGKM